MAHPVATLGLARDALSRAGARVTLLAELLAVLKALQRGSCWCEMGIGNPMMSRHSQACLAAQAAIAKADSASGTTTASSDGCN